MQKWCWNCPFIISDWRPLTQPMTLQGKGASSLRQQDLLVYVRQLLAAECNYLPCNQLGLVAVTGTLLAVELRRQQLSDKWTRHEQQQHSCSHTPDTVLIIVFLKKTLQSETYPTVLKMYNFQQQLSSEIISDI